MATRHPRWLRRTTATIAESATNGLSVALDDGRRSPMPARLVTLTWSIVQWQHWAMPSPSIATTGAVTVQDASQIDFENNWQLYALVVRATDKGSPSLNGASHPEHFDYQCQRSTYYSWGKRLSIKENSSAGSVVGTATASDPRPQPNVAVASCWWQW